MNNTLELRKALPGLVMKYDVRSFFDAACGSFVWMCEGLKDIQKLRPDLDFHASDIVPHVIEANVKKFPDVSFSVHDMVHDPLPRSYDVIMARDVFFHLTYSNIMCAVKRFQDSGSRYLLTTTCLAQSFPGLSNVDMSRAGGWRRIFLQESPFKFGEPLEWIDEQYAGKPLHRMMGLWDLKSLPRFECNE